MAGCRFWVARLFFAVDRDGRVFRLPLVVALVVGFASASVKDLVSSPSLSSFLRLSLRAPALILNLEVLEERLTQQGVDVAFLGRHHGALHVLDGELAHTHRGDEQLLGLDPRAVGGCQPDRRIAGLGLQADLTSELGRDGREAGSRIKNHFRGDLAETGVDMVDAVLSVQLDSFGLD